MERTETSDCQALDRRVSLVLEASRGIWPLVCSSAKRDAGKGDQICEMDWKNDWSNWKMALEGHLGDSKVDQRPCSMDLEAGDSKSTKSCGTLGALGRGWIYLGGQGCLECDLEDYFIFVDGRCSNYVVLSEFNLEGHLEWILRCFEGRVCHLAQADRFVDYGFRGWLLQNDEAGSWRAGAYPLVLRLFSSMGGDISAEEVVGNIAKFGKLDWKGWV